MVRRRQHPEVFVLNLRVNIHKVAIVDVTKQTLSVEPRILFILPDADIDVRSCHIMSHEHIQVHVKEERDQSLRKVALLLEQLSPLKYLHYFDKLVYFQPG